MASGSGIIISKAFNERFCKTKDKNHLHAARFFIQGPCTVSQFIWPQGRDRHHCVHDSVLQGSWHPVPS